MAKFPSFNPKMICLQRFYRANLKQPQTAGRPIMCSALWTHGSEAKESEVKHSLAALMKLLWYWYVMRGAGNILGTQVRENVNKNPNSCGWHHYFLHPASKHSGTSVESLLPEESYGSCWSRPDLQAVGPSVSPLKQTCVFSVGMNASLCNRTPPSLIVSFPVMSFCCLLPLLDVPRPFLRTNVEIPRDMTDF